jgi:hypothetical protein
MTYPENYTSRLNIAGISALFQGLPLKPTVMVAVLITHISLSMQFGYGIQGIPIC